LSVLPESGPAAPLSWPAVRGRNVSVATLPVDTTHQYGPGRPQWPSSASLAMSRSEFVTLLSLVEKALHHGWNRRRHPRSMAQNAPENAKNATRFPAHLLLNAWHHESVIAGRTDSGRVSRDAWFAIDARPGPAALRPRQGGVPARHRYAGRSLVPAVDGVRHDRPGLIPAQQLPGPGTPFSDARLRAWARSRGAVVLRWSSDRWT